MAALKLTTGKDKTNQPLYTTALITPGANRLPGVDRLVLAFVMNIRETNALAATPELSGNNLNWVRVESVAVPGKPDRRLTCFRALGPDPKPGPVTISFKGERQSRCAWSIFEYDQVDTTGKDGENAVLQVTVVSGANQVSARYNLKPFADPVRSVAVGGIVIALDNEPDRSVTLGGGLDLIDEQPFGDGQGRGGTLQTQERTGEAKVDPNTDDWVWDWTNAGARNFAAIILEVASPPFDVEALAKRFEPILHFHPDERFFPSDAKRYLEACALWRAETPFDDKILWRRLPPLSGTKPLIPAGGIAGAPGEPGELLGSKAEHLTDSKAEERFLNLAGWKDAASAPQPDVTATSQNTYSERDGIATRYNEDDNKGGERRLRESRFRYHAEFFDTARLKHLLSGVSEPELSLVLENLNNPALLCYYFFYPAHDEPIDTTYTTSR